MAFDPNRNVYNNTHKITEPNSNFMSDQNIREAVLNLKLKNSEGFDMGIA